MQIFCYYVYILLSFFLTYKLKDLLYDHFIGHVINSSMFQVLQTSVENPRCNIHANIVYIICYYPRFFHSIEFHLRGYRFDQLGCFMFCRVL